eukprot:Rmarinus@m.29470
MFWTLACARKGLLGLLTSAAQNVLPERTRIHLGILRVLRARKDPPVRSAVTVYLIASATRGTLVLQPGKAERLLASLVLTSLSAWTRFTIARTVRRVKTPQEALPARAIPDSGGVE